MEQLRTVCDPNVLSPFYPIIQTNFTWPLVGYSVSVLRSDMYSGWTSHLCYLAPVFVYPILIQR
jgi:hypothetical protein